MECDLIERVFANPAVLSLGAPLVSACLRLAGQGSWERSNDPRVSIIRCRRCGKEAPYPADEIVHAQHLPSSETLECIKHAHPSDQNENSRLIPFNGRSARFILRLGANPELEALSLAKSPSEFEKASPARDACGIAGSRHQLPRGTLPGVLSHQG